MKLCCDVMFFFYSNLLCQKQNIDYFWNLICICLKYQVTGEQISFLEWAYKISNPKCHSYRKSSHNKIVSRFVWLLKISVNFALRFYHPLFITAIKKSFIVNFYCAFNYVWLILKFSLIKYVSTISTKIYINVYKRTLLYMLVRYPT